MGVAVYKRSDRYDRPDSVLIVQPWSRYRHALWPHGIVFDVTADSRDGPKAYHATGFTLYQMVSEGVTEHLY